jgi:hypothetical protein
MALRRAEHRAALLKFLQLARDHIADTERMVRSAVVDARAAGATWNQIGDALGVTPQEAKDRVVR